MSDTAMSPDEECLEEGKLEKKLLDKEEGVESQPQAEGCCANCMRCLAGIACRTLAALVLVLLGVGAFAGSTIIGMQRTRDLIDDKELVPYFEFIIIGVTAGSAFLCILFFILGTLSVGWTARHVWNTSAKNTCARGLTIFCMILAFFLHFSWQVVSCVCMTPVVLLALSLILKNQGLDCYDLKNYGFPARQLCGGDFDVFVNEGYDVLICWVVAVIAAIIVVFALGFFIICMGCDYNHLHETKFATYNSYEKADGKDGNAADAI